MIQNRRLALCALLACSLVGAISQSLSQTTADPVTARAGWTVIPTQHKFVMLSERLEAAVKANKMGIVTSASASEGAKAQGIQIAGNRVVGVFRNDFARRMLAASVPAGIEAPIRFYLTENADGFSTLSFKTPSAIFTPYQAGAGSDLMKVAEELDAIFAKIAREAVGRE